MSTNMEMLRAKMADADVTITRLSEILGVDQSTFYRKLNSKGENFTVGQMHQIVDALKLTKEEAASIFLW